jgi:hypothetical protein
MSALTSVLDRLGGLLLQLQCFVILGVKIVKTVSLSWSSKKIACGAKVEID